MDKKIELLRESILAITGDYGKTGNNQKKNLYIAFESLVREINKTNE
jgi:hypothetical protein